MNVTAIAASASAPKPHATRPDGSRAPRPRAHVSQKQAPATATSASLTPPQTTRSAGTRAPRPHVTAAPFSPAAQKQANAINTGRQPPRGRIVNVVV